MAKQTDNRPFDLDSFVRSYVAAIYFTDTGEADQPHAGIEMHPHAMARAKDECAAFLWRAYPYLEHAARATDESRESIYERAAHDFWFTRNGHGVGFWEDSRWPVAGKILDEKARAFGSVDSYETDCGTLDQM